jgi:hypothetical protein
MDTSDYCLLIRMIRTSERPSNAESQNVGLPSLIGSTSSVSTSKPPVPADQLILRRNGLLQVSINNSKVVILRIVAAINALDPDWRNTERVETIAGTRSGSYIYRSALQGRDIRYRQLGSFDLHPGVWAKDLGGVVWKRPSNLGSLRGEDVPGSLHRFSKSEVENG